MRSILILAVALALTAGCASGIRKQFTLTVDPPDAQITVITRPGQTGESYRSPAEISVSLPKEPNLASQSRIVISRQNYKTTELKLSSIQGNSLRITLSKAFQYRLKYSMLRPFPSDDLTFQDRTLAIRIVPREQHLDLKINNLTQKPLSILWDRADYTDAMNRQYRIILSRTKGPNKPARTAQVIPVGGSLQESVMPEGSVEYSVEKKGYVTKPLFVLDDPSALTLKGRTVSLFLPIEIDGAIIPNYTFTIRIDDVIKE